MNSYFLALFAIGGVRALVMSRDLVQMDYHDHDLLNRPRDLLITERMRCAAIGAVLFPITWPISTFSDARRLEIDIRNAMTSTSANGDEASASASTITSMIRKPKIKSLMDIVF